LSPEVAGNVVAIDGKTLRGSHDGGNRRYTSVSAFASGSRDYFRAVKTSENPMKSPAIPELIRMVGRARSHRDH